MCYLPPTTNSAVSFLLSLMARMEKSSYVNGVSAKPQILLGIVPNKRGKYESGQHEFQNGKHCANGNNAYANNGT
jgi:hypothetical protein